MGNEESTCHHDHHRCEENIGFRPEGRQKVLTVSKVKELMRNCATIDVEDDDVQNVEKFLIYSDRRRENPYEVVIVDGYEQSSDVPQMFPVCRNQEFRYLNVVPRAAGPIQIQMVHGHEEELVRFLLCLLDTPRQPKEKVSKPKKSKRVPRSHVPASSAAATASCENSNVFYQVNCETVQVDRNAVCSIAGVAIHQTSHINEIVYALNAPTAYKIVNTWGYRRPDRQFGAEEHSNFELFLNRASMGCDAKLYKDGDLLVGANAAVYYLITPLTDPLMRLLASGFVTKEEIISSLKRFVGYYNELKKSDERETTKQNAASVMAAFFSLVNEQNVIQWANTIPGLVGSISVAICRAMVSVSNNDCFSANEIIKKLLEYAFKTR